MNDWGETVSAVVARLLREARRERALTMEELADRADLDRTYIGLLERGERRPTVAAAASIAAALGLHLSDLLALAEHESSESDPESRLQSALPPVELVPSPPKRSVSRDLLRPTPALTATTRLTGDVVAGAIESAYHTLDLIDEQLLAKGSEPLSRLVELANLSSILGNLLAGGLAQVAFGLYRRSGPHKFPDLLATDPAFHDLEVKTALEGNQPKGHLPKAGAYLTFRYVLTSREGVYVRGKGYRGKVCSIWEVKFGLLGVKDFATSSTLGDSGKTAAIRPEAFKAMELIYFDPSLSPSPRLSRFYSLGDSPIRSE